MNATAPTATVTRPSKINTMTIGIPNRPGAGAGTVTVGAGAGGVAGTVGTTTAEPEAAELPEAGGLLESPVAVLEPVTGAPVGWTTAGAVLGFGVMTNDPRTGFCPASIVQVASTVPRAVGPPLAFSGVSCKVRQLPRHGLAAGPANRRINTGVLEGRRNHVLASGRWPGTRDHQTARRRRDDHRVASYSSND